MKEFFNKIGWQFIILLLSLVALIGGFGPSLITSSNKSVSIFGVINYLGNGVSVGLVWALVFLLLGIAISIITFVLTLLKVKFNGIGYLVIAMGICFLICGILFSYGRLFAYISIKSTSGLENLSSNYVGRGTIVCAVFSFLACLSSFFKGTKDVIKYKKEQTHEEY